MPTNVENELMTIDKMMNFVEQKVYPLDGIVYTEKITKKQILKLYKIVKNADDLFTNIIQVHYFRKLLDEINGHGKAQKF
jgi:hypothetical protein